MFVATSWSLIQNVLKTDQINGEQKAICGVILFFDHVIESQIGKVFNISWIMPDNHIRCCSYRIKLKGMISYFLSIRTTVF